MTDDIVARLRGEVERLTRERDEAIARGDRWMERHRDASRLLEAERNAALDARDESIGHLHEAALKLRDAEAKFAKLRGAMEEAIAYMELSEEREKAAWRARAILTETSDD